MKTPIVVILVCVIAVSGICAPTVHNDDNNNNNDNDESTCPPSSVVRSSISNNCLLLNKDSNFNGTSSFNTTSTTTSTTSSSTSTSANINTLLLENQTLNNVKALFVELRKCSNLTRIILTRIALPSNDNLTESLLISGPTTLKYFKFSLSNLNILPTFAKNLSDLEHLDLTGNAFRTIASDRFRTSKLQVLNLSVNHVESIASDAFGALRALKCLDLSRNKLSTIGERVLKPLESLQHLNLSDNRLQALNQNCFAALTCLQHLDLSFNQLSSLESLELPSLARLLLNDNPELGSKDGKKTALFVTAGRRLQTVDASRIGLKQVPAALTHSIRTLRLSGNRIKLINRGDMDSYPLLQLLDFTSNNLSDVEEDALGRLESLTILYLTDNQLRSIPHSLPEHLRVLHLENNKIESLQNTDLDGLTQLEVLLLNGNRIATVKETSFAQMARLISLDLSRNPVRELPAGILAGPVGLRVLRLSGLDVVMSPAKDLAFPLPTTEHLINLDLSSSPGMARQMLADTAALAAARELQELNLSGNELNYIRSDLLHYLPQLRALHLKDNPLNCSGMEWLAEWLREQDEPEYREIVCASPPDQWNTLLIDLQSIETITTTISPMTSSTSTSATTFKTFKAANDKTRYIKRINHHGDGHKTEITTLSTPKGNADKADIVGTSTTAQTVDIIRSDNDVFGNIGGGAGRHTTTTTNVMNILNIHRLDGKKVNRILKEERDDEFHYQSLAPSNLFMKKSLQTSTKNNNNNNEPSHREAVQTAVEATAVKAKAVEAEAVEAEEVKASSGINVTTGEMSMYSGTIDKKNVHPGMYVLGLAILTASATLVMLTARFTRRSRNIPQDAHHSHRHHRHRRHHQHQHEDIEVNSLPSVTELW